MMIFPEDFGSLCICSVNLNLCISIGSPQVLENGTAIIRFLLLDEGTLDWNYLNIGSALNNYTKIKNFIHDRQGKL